MLIGSGGVLGGTLSNSTDTEIQGPGLSADQLYIVGDCTMWSFSG